MWSYTFTNYSNFWIVANAVTPRPNWLAPPHQNVPVSTTIPLNETDYNAMALSAWKQFGKEFFIKSNINNWVVCSPDIGSWVEWRDGDVICKIAKHMTATCSDGPPPSYFKRAVNCGPAVKGGVGVAFIITSMVAQARTNPHMTPVDKTVTKA